MGLHLMSSILLPEHIKPGGFDHAAIHGASYGIYVAHTTNDAIDVIDGLAGRYLHSITGLTGVAGVLVSNELNLIFTSNRGENTVGIFSPGHDRVLIKIPVGIRPNGLAFDPGKKLLLAANVGNPDVPGSYSLSIVDIEAKKMIHEIEVPGRTRWAIFDACSAAFYVNISDPPQIMVVESAHPDRVSRTLAIPAAGPHGLDLDPENRRLFCACDAGKLIVINIATGKISGEAALSGPPDVIFNNSALHHLYIAVGDPGVIDVLDSRNLEKLETITTEMGGHTIACDSNHNKVYAFLPQTHRAAVFMDD